MSLDLGVILSERKPHGTYQRAGNIIGSVNSAGGGPLVRQLPPTEEPAESAAKKREYERSHRSKERDACATKVSAKEGKSLERNRNDFTTQFEEG